MARGLALRSSEIVSRQTTALHEGQQAAGVSVEEKPFFFLLQILLLNEPVLRVYCTLFVRHVRMQQGFFFSTARSPTQSAPDPSPATPTPRTKWSSFLSISTLASLCLRKSINCTHRQLAGPLFAIPCFKTCQRSGSSTQTPDLIRPIFLFLQIVEELTAQGQEVKKKRKKTICILKPSTFEKYGKIHVPPPPESSEVRAGFSYLTLELRPKFPCLELCRAFAGRGAHFSFLF